MISPLNEKLSNVKWGKFSLGELLEITPSKFYRLPNEEILSDSGGVPVISNSTVNNGVMGYSNLLPINSGNTISCSDTTLGCDTMFYQKISFIGYAHIQHLIPKFKTFNSAIAHAIITSSRKTSKDKYDYGNKFNRKNMRATQIYLPFRDKRIDFDFINSFISEIEHDFLIELDQYLSRNGLKNCLLTTEEKNALNNISNLNYKSYNLKSLFGKSTRGKRLKSEDRVPGNLPFVTAGEADEGVSDFIGNKVTVFSKNTTTIDMFGSAKYRSYEYGADDHVAVVHTEKLKENAAIFVTSAIHKSSHNGQFDYGRNFYAKDADALDILLPEKDGLPDYELMELIISAVKKLIITAVVNFTNNKLESHKTLQN